VDEIPADGKRLFTRQFTAFAAAVGLETIDFDGNPRFISLKRRHAYENADDFNGSDGGGPGFPGVCG
jgi:hypothetical protein